MKGSTVFAIALYCLGSLVPFTARAEERTSPGPDSSLARLQTKSPGRAFLYSFLGTALPVGIGTATSLGKNEVSAGVLVALGGGIVGPSLGHWYAGRPGKAIRGILVRGAATGIGWAAVAAANSSSSGESADTELLVFLSSGVVGLIFLGADIVDAPGSARAHNEEVARSRVTATPFVGSVEAAPGVGVRLAF